MQNPTTLSKNLKKNKKKKQKKKQHKNYLPKENLRNTDTFIRTQKSSYRYICTLKV